MWRGAALALVARVALNHGLKRKARSSSLSNKMVSWFQLALQIQRGHWSRWTWWTRWTWTNILRLSNCLWSHSTPIVTWESRFLVPSPGWPSRHAAAPKQNLSAIAWRAAQHPGRGKGLSFIFHFNLSRLLAALPETGPSSPFGTEKHHLVITFRSRNWRWKIEKTWDEIFSDSHNILTGTLCGPLRSCIPPRPGASKRSARRPKAHSPAACNETLPGNAKQAGNTKTGLERNHLRGYRRYDFNINESFRMTALPLQCKQVFLSHISSKFWQSLPGASLCLCDVAKRGGFDSQQWYWPHLRMRRLDENMDISIDKYYLILVKYSIAIRPTWQLQGFIHWKAFIGQERLWWVPLQRRFSLAEMRHATPPCLAKWPRP